MSQCMRAFLDSPHPECLLCLRMSRLPRIFVVAIIALWLPLCCCQLTAFAGEFGGATSDSCCSQTCCGESASDEHSEGDAPCETPSRSCSHCVVKAPAPQPISLDAFFVMSAIAFEVVLPPSSIDPSCLYATEHDGGWPLAPPLEPPAPPLHGSARCATLSLWTI